jgi:CTP synthase
VNIQYVSRLEEKGMMFVGRDTLGERMEIMELQTGHPFYAAVQYHPEFTSRPVRPSPIFSGFVSAAIKHRGD